MCPNPKSNLAEEGKSPTEKTIQDQQVMPVGRGVTQTLRSTPSQATVMVALVVANGAVLVKVQEMTGLQIETTGMKMPTGTEMMAMRMMRTEIGSKGVARSSHHGDDVATENLGLQSKEVEDDETRSSAAHGCQEIGMVMAVKSGSASKIIGVTTTTKRIIGRMIIGRELRLWRSLCQQ